MKFRVGMGQMLVEGGKPEQNIKRAGDFIRRAAESDCTFVVLPECLDLGWSHPSAKNVDTVETIPGKYSKVICEIAKKHGIYVVAGLTEKIGNRIYNAAVMISAGGEIILKHRKINIYPNGPYAVGDSLSVKETPFGKVAVTICSDNFLKSLTLGHSLGRMGTQMLLSPCAWFVDSDDNVQHEPFGGNFKDAYITLAKLYDMIVIGVSCVGEIKAGDFAGKKCIGYSLAIGPGGEILGRGPYGSHAQELIILETNPVESKCYGSNIIKMLYKKGYERP